MNLNRKKFHIANKGSLLMAFLLCVVFHSSATDYYVNDNTTLLDVYTTSTGSNTTGTGTSANPYANLKYVIDNAPLASGDRIFVDAGTYSQVDIQIVITIPNLEIIGAGSGITVFDNSGSGGTQEYFMRILANGVQLSGMTITGYDYHPGSWGKAITVQGATGVVLNDVSTVDNKDNGDAAIFILSNSDVTILNSTSSCNQSNYGGGVQVEGNNITVLIDNCIIANNRKTLFWGGGILIMGASGASSNVTVTIQNSSISDNIAIRGGGIYVSGAELNITNSCFNGNIKNLSNDGGAGLYVGYNSTVNLTQCSFTYNTANTSAADGGAICVAAQNSNVTITQCEFDGNYASDDGNAIYVDRLYSSGAATVTVTESIFGTNQNNFRKSDANFTISNSGTRQIDSGSSGIGGNDVAQSLGPPTTNCPSLPDPCYITVLPVELLNFSANCIDENSIALNWSTATELNNDYFTLYSSETGHDWTIVDEIKGAGTSQSIQQYQYVWAGDRASYFKLSQRDFDGIQEDLRIEYASFDCSNAIPFTAFFNGSFSTIEVDYYANETELANIQLVDAMGKVIAQKECLFNRDKFHESININSTVVNGIYYLIIAGKNDAFSTKVYIQR